MKNKNLIIIAGSSSQGGAESQLFKLIKSLKNFDIFIFFFSGKKNDYGIFKEFSKEAHLKLFPINIENSFKFIQTINLIVSISKKDKEKSKILGWLPKGNLIALLIGLISYKQTTIFCSHRSKFILNQSFQSQFLLISSLFLFRIYPKKVSHIINSPNITKNKLIKFFLRSKPIYIKNCFIYEKNKSLYKIKKNKSNYLKLLIVARFSKEKGYELLFKALSNLNCKFKLKCIGEGCTYENPYFNKLCLKYSIEPQALETTKNLSKIYGDNDFLIVPSYSESSPNVIVEAILEGTPSIITPTGVYTSLLKKFNLVSNSFNSNDLTEVLKKGFLLKSDPIKYEAVRRELLKKIKLYISTPSEAAKEYEKLFLNN